MTDAVMCVQPGQHQTFHPAKGIVLRLLHGGPSYQAFLLQVEANTTYRSAPHDGEELRYVISGEVTFTVESRHYRVAAGGTLRHPSTVPHGFFTGSRPASFLTFALSRSYDVRRFLEGQEAAAPRQDAGSPDPREAGAKGREPSQGGV